MRDNSSIISTVDQDMYNLHKLVINGFSSIVADTKLILLSGLNPLIHLGLSHGKDSTVCALAVIEAYAQAINENLIEAARPLIISTVDTSMEALPMVMYVRYSSKHLLEYARSKNINIYYDVVKPSFQDEYANRYLTAQKLLPSPLRTGECSVILKVNPNQHYLKNLLKRFSKSSDTAQYSEANVITVTGSRTSEGVRRSSNMSTQGVRDKSISDLMNEIEACEFDGLKLFKYAPIRDWEDIQVFTALELAGSKPLTKNLLRVENAIPGHFSDFALLLAIYGNATNETCEIAVGSTTGASCNGSSRYGCNQCLMVGAIDKSQTALTNHERWNFLGQEEILRVRDYSFRLANDMTARAHHAKSVDTVGFNRLALQPNVLKPRFLERLVRFFSQLTVLSAQRAAEFRAYPNKSEHPAMLEIKNDPTLSAKARRSFLAMYEEQAQKPLVELFSERHAIYLSWKWSIDGIATLPYRAIGIWEEALMGESKWVPFPKTNKEMESMGVNLAMNQHALPDAVMMTTLNKEDSEYLDLHASYSLFKHDDSTIQNVIEDDMDCSTTREADSRVAIEFHAKSTIQFGAGDAIYAMVNNEFTLITNLTLSESVLDSAKVGGRKVNKLFLDLMKEKEYPQLIANKFSRMVKELNEDILTQYGFTSISEARKIVDSVCEKRFGGTSVKGFISHLKSTDIFSTYQLKSRKAAPKQNFTRRRAKWVKSKLTKATTRLNFYSLDLNTRLHKAHVNTVKQILPEFTAYSHNVTSVATDELFCNNNMDETVRVSITQHDIDQWMLTDSYAKAVKRHRQCLEEIKSKKPWIRERLSKTGSVRLYTSTSVADKLMLEGVVKISPKYMPTFRAIKSRTAKIEAIGGFEFQSLSHEQLVRKPWAITMTQHRKDKAVLLLELRKKLNKQRAEVKAALKNPAGGSEANQKTHMRNVTGLLDQYTFNAQHAAFGFSFDGMNVNRKTKANAYLSAAMLGSSEFNNKTAYLKAINANDNSSNIEMVRNASRSLRIAVKKSQFEESIWKQLRNSISEVLSQFETDFVKWSALEPHCTRNVNSTLADLRKYDSECKEFKINTDQLRSELKTALTMAVTSHYPEAGLHAYQAPDVGHINLSFTKLYRSLVERIELSAEASVNAHKISEIYRKFSESSVRSTLANMGALESLSVIRTPALKTSEKTLFNEEKIIVQAKKVKPEKVKKTTKPKPKRTLTLDELLMAI